MADRMRASDAEREETVALLRHAVGEGRLDMEEFTDRTTRAYLAKTRGELLELIDDIPRAQLAPRPPSAPSLERPLPRIPGRFGFSARWVAPARRRRAATELEEFVAPPMRAHGYTLDARRRGAHGLRTRAPPGRGRTWSQCLLFPIGLIALLHKDRAEIVFELRERGEETLITASGRAPLALRRALSELER